MPSKPEILPHVDGSLNLEEIKCAGLAGMPQSEKSKRRGSTRTVLRESTEESPKESVLARLHSKCGRCCFWQPRRGPSAPLLPARAGLGGVPARRQARGARGGPRQGPEHPRRDGFACVCVTRLLVTEPFSSACEMSVVTELRPTKKRSFYSTWWRGEKKKKSILLKSKYSF